MTRDIAIVTVTIPLYFIIETRQSYTSDKL